MNPDLDKLQPYPFETLARLTVGVAPPPHLRPISLSIGEPRHPPPPFALAHLRDNLHRLGNYPTTKGLPELRSSIARWLEKRFGLARGVDPESQILPVNGTREALFAFTQAALDRSTHPLVVYQNPFYQIYEGATLLAGGEPYLMNCGPENGYLPDFDAVPEHIWQRCQLLFVCSPGNPSGTVIPLEQYQKLIHLADTHDFIIASDECYSEIYQDEDRPPVGLLEACHSLARHDFKRCVVFHSLSKRSNVPGMRSGFVAGDAGLLKRFLQYRTYHGCAMSVPFQLASIELWQDETHVKENRDAYREKFRQVASILGDVLPVSVPPASFYLWPQTPIDDETFARELLATQNVAVLPGRYLGRTTPTGNPGDHHCRFALVATIDDCVEAAHRIRHFIESIQP